MSSKQTTSKLNILRPDFVLKISREKARIKNMLWEMKNEYSTVSTVYKVGNR